ncbi:acyltransferase domain-containing protein, partial [Nocardia sp. NPDC004654]|uniref:acyltransferase domain-containing protein n=1 Tax=Nocardia sp. NPDC004654 TaxID=3154776 RepID=UPI0033AC4159
TPWTDTDRPRRAGISSFGISGTNAHLILQAAPPTPNTTETTPAQQKKDPNPRVPIPWLLSARTQAALQDQAKQLRDFVVANPDLDAGAVAHTLAFERHHFHHRAAAIGKDREELLMRLGFIVEGTSAANVIYDRTRASDGTAFLFTGQGSQHPGMGEALYQGFPRFRQALDEVFERLDEHLDRPLREVMFAESGSVDASLLDQTAYTQPAIFAFEYALHRLLTDTFGITPRMLAGHSIGEFAAAHAAGVFTLDDAAELVAVRGRLMDAAEPLGAMINIEASEVEILAAFTDENPEQIAIAAVNAPDSVVISGDKTCVGRLAEGFRARGRRVRELRVSHAFHSPHMNPILPEFRRIAERVNYAPPKIPVVSGCTGTVVEASDITTPDYWANQIRMTVRFNDCIQTMCDNGVTRFLEVGPDAVLTPLVGTHPSLPLAVPTCIKRKSEMNVFLSAVARLHAHGETIMWDKLFSNCERTNLPTYPFQHRAFWLANSPERAAARGSTHSDRFWDTVERNDLDGAAVVLQATPQEREALAIALKPLHKLRQRDLNNSPGISNEPDNELRGRLVDATETERLGIVTDLVRTQLAAALGHDSPDAITTDTSIIDLGLTSFIVLELCNQLAARGLAITPRAVFEQPTVAKLASHLCSTIVKPGEQASP